MRWTAADQAELEALEAWVEAQTFDPLERYCPHEPSARQAEFLDLTCLEALYGGAAGGGKSDALLMGALQYVNVPGYGALLLRRTFRELEGHDGLIPRSQEWLRDTDAVWSASKLTWTFPSGAKIHFGHMQHLGDETLYQGHALQFVGYDETTHFHEKQWTYLLTRVRRPKIGALSRVPLRLRGATNPGGIGHGWVMSRFGIQEDGTQDRDEATNDETGQVRAFVPAKLVDNPHLDIDSYRLSFANVDSITRAQLEEGRWIRDGSGLVYGGFNRRRNTITLDEWARLQREHTWRYVLSIDPGSSLVKPTTAFGLLAYSETHHRVVCVKSWAEAALIPSTMAGRIGETRDGLDREGRELMWVVVDQGALGSGYANEFRARFGEDWIQPAKKADKLGHRKLLNGDFERGHLLLLEGQNDELLTELETLPANEAGTDAEKGFADHLTDQLLYGWRSCLGFAAEPPATAPAPGTPEWGRLEEQRMEQAARAELWATKKPWYETVIEGDETPWYELDS